MSSNLPQGRRRPFQALHHALSAPRHHLHHASDPQHNSVLNSDLNCTTHIRRRGEQRGIRRTALQEARRYGMREKGRFGRWKITYKGMVFIWDPKRNRGITCWNLRNTPNVVCGTKAMRPLMIEKSRDHESPAAKAAHNELKQCILSNKENWNSHSVIVVDMSGSMRRDDVNGARCRSDAVWSSLARKVFEQIGANNLNERSIPNDLVSVVLMRETAQVMLECEPTDYVLYNKLVHLREWTNAQPRGQGYFKTAMEAAERLLQKNSLWTCGLSLLLFSDGRPSDPAHHNIPKMMGRLANRFGERLTLTCVGIAHHQGKADEFRVLREMVDEAKVHGCRAVFEAPATTTSDSLDHIIESHLSSSHSSSMSDTMSIRGGQQRMELRSDLVREHQGGNEWVDCFPDSRYWRLFKGPRVTEGSYTSEVWKWNSKNNSLCRIIDPRCANCSVLVHDRRSEFDDTSVGRICTGCRAVFFCHDCYQSRMVIHSQEQCLNMADQRRQGHLVRDKVLPTFDVAWKKGFFSRGAERIAYKFQFMDKDAFFGPLMVAKESRFIEKHQITPFAAGSYGIQINPNLVQDRHQYHKQFALTQSQASNYADIYNATLDSYESECLDPILKEKLINLPRVRFLNCFIFDLVQNGESVSVLVEPYIHGSYRKYNNNNGQRARNASSQSNLNNWASDLDQRFHTLLLTPPSHSQRSNAFAPAMVGGGLEPVVEDTEDTEDEQDGDEDEAWAMKTDDVAFSSGARNRVASAPVLGHGLEIRDEDFMDAFSHFTYEFSSCQHMVVDLQGSTKQVGHDGRREFVLTDPAIHSRNRHDRMLSGRTNRGKRGMDAFFRTHKCNAACRLFGLPRRKNANINGRFS